MKRTFIAAATMALISLPALADPCGFDQRRQLVVVGYGVGATAVPKDQRTALTEFAETAKHRFGICIFAQVDSQGSDEANKRIAAARAENVRKFLVARGVRADAIKIAKQEKGFTLFGLLPKDQDDDRRVVVTHD